MFNRFSSRFLVIVALSLAGVLLLAINLFASNALRGIRLDLTEDRLYTVSESTKKMLANMDEPVTLRFYYTRQLGERSSTISNYAARVRELLQRYEELSDGTLRLEVYNPEPFSDEEDKAVADGIQGVPMSSSGDLGYFGLVGTNSVDDQEGIPFLDAARDRFLEYDLSRLIDNLSHPERPVLGLLSTLPLSGDMTRGMPPTAIYAELEGLFTVRELSPDSGAIDDEIDILMVVHPRNVSPATLYAIDQFVLAGGPALVFVDPFSEVEGRNRRPGGPPVYGGSNLYELMQAWGVEMPAEDIVVDLEAATRVDAGGGKRASITEYVVWLTMHDGFFNKEEVVTADLETLAIGSVGHLEHAPEAKTSFTPLVTSSLRSQVIDVNQVRFRPDPVKLLNEFQADETRHVLAARLRGPATTAFPDGPPAMPAPAEKEVEEGEENAPSLGDETGPGGRAEGEINVAVIADTDILDDPFWVDLQAYYGQGNLVPVADNGNFVINLVESLLGRETLIGLRGRGSTARPFDLVVNYERRAEQRFRAQEQALLKKLQDTELELEQLQRESQEAGAPVMSEEQKATVERFRADMVQTRKELRQVQRELRKDIDRLDNLAKFANIVAIPLFIALLAVVLALVRRVRRAHYGRRDG